MAKGSFLGVKRGKLGDAVGYNVANSSDGIRQGWRIYQPVVRNPQTDGQMVQRVKLAAVNNLYRDLKEVIRRSMENKKYGDESRRAWLSMALGQAFNGPWISKGFTLGLPIDGVPISVGSLVPIEIVERTGQYLTCLFPVESVLDPNVHEGTTIGKLSSAFIAAGYQAGDQVTFVYGWVPMRQAFTWRVISFYLDETSVVELETIGISSYTVGTDAETNRDYIQPQFNDPCDALAVIISRDGQTQGSHLRSTAYVGMTATAAANWYSQLAYDIAKRSYLKTDAVNTNWPLVPGGEGGGGGSTITAFTISGTEIVPGSLTNVAAEPAEIVDANGQHYFVRAHTSAGGTRYLYGQGDGDFTSSATAPTGATNANTIDPCAANNIASGCRAWLLAKGVSADLLVTT